MATSNPTAIYFNPAGMSLMGGTRLMLDGTFAWRSLTYTRDPGAIDNVLVEDNLIGGGGFTIYATQVGYPMTNVRFVSNRFTTSVFALVGYWATDSDGYCGLLYPSGLPADLVFSDNVIHETGAPVTR